jgi:hypothetical protein
MFYWTGNTLRQWSIIQLQKKNSKIFDAKANIIDSQRRYPMFQYYTDKATAFIINNSHTKTFNIVQNHLTE